MFRLNGLDPSSRPSRAEIEALVCARSEARTTGNWEVADEIRAALDGWGFGVQDAADGSTDVVDIRDALRAKVAAERAHIDRVWRAAAKRTGARFDSPEAQSAGREGVAVLLRRAAKKDNLPLLKRTLRAAIGYFEDKGGEGNREEHARRPGVSSCPADKDELKGDDIFTNTTVSGAAADLLNVGNVNKKTALHFAAQNAGPNMIRFLLRHGANVNAHCTRGQTPICFAIAKRRYRNAEVLLDAGASLLIRTVLGETPLDLAIAHVALPRRDLVLRMREAFRREIETKTNPSTNDDENDTMWQDFTGNEDAILNQLEHARTCENCQANARALGRGGQISITSVGSGKRRTRRHFDFDFDDESDDDGSTGHVDDSMTQNPVEPSTTGAEAAGSAGAEAGVPDQQTNESKIKPEAAENLDRGSRRAQKSRCAALEYTQRHGKIRKAAANPNGDACDLRDLLQRGREKWGKSHSNYASLVESPSPGSGRTALMMAAWRGHLNNVALLLDEGASIDRYTKRSGNYGKTPIFYALTRCRDEVVLLLLSRGANVLIVNNKGQTPRSLAVSHLAEETTEQVARIEAEQLAAGGTWCDFRESHSDGVAYGDLDVRFLDADNLRGRGGWDTTGSHDNAITSSDGGGKSGRDSRWSRLGGPQDPATGSSRRWEGSWDLLSKIPGGKFPFPPPTKGGVCVRPTKRYASRRPFETGEKPRKHETRLEHAVHVEGKGEPNSSSRVAKDTTGALSMAPHSDISISAEGVDGCGSQRSILLPWAQRWLESEAKREAAAELGAKEAVNGVAPGASCSPGSDGQMKEGQTLGQMLVEPLRVLADETLRPNAQPNEDSITECSDDRAEEARLADLVASRLSARIRKDLGRTGSKSAFLIIQTELIEVVARVAQACANSGYKSRGFRVLLCLAQVADDERIRRVLRGILKKDEAQLGRSVRRRAKEGVTKASRRIQRVIVKIFAQAMKRVLGNAEFAGAIAAGSKLWGLLGANRSREIVVRWLVDGGLSAAALTASGVCPDLVKAVGLIVRGGDGGGGEKWGAEHKIRSEDSGENNEHKTGHRKTKDTIRHPTAALDTAAVSALLTVDHHNVVADILKGRQKMLNSDVKDPAPTESRYIRLRLNFGNGENVRMVATLESARAMRVFLEKEIENSLSDSDRGGGVLLGVDTEWGDDGKGCAVVQVATVNKVFLIDLMPAHQGEPDEIDGSTDGQELLATIRWLMSEPRLMKIGFSFAHDWEQLERIVPGVSKESASVVDLQSYIVNTALAETGRGDLVGLSTVVKKYFGAPLDKTEQCSAWCHRPLSANQIKYAALDALILVDLAALLCSKAK